MKKTLIIVEARPLIALATTASLNALLLPGVRIIVPDMVKQVMTEYADKPIANKVLDWLDAQAIYIGITDAYREFKILRSVMPAVKTGGREERAVAAILAKELEKGIDEIMLLFDESHFDKPPNYLRPLPANVSSLSVSLLLEAQKARPEAYQDVPLDRPLKANTAVSKTAKKKTGRTSISDTQYVLGARLSSDGKQFIASPFDSVIETKHLLPDED